MVSILTGVRWNLDVVLICISFMVRDVEHFFHVSFVKALCSSFTHFFIGSLIFLGSLVF
jgi:hypothetical protein